MKSSIKMLMGILIATMALNLLASPPDKSFSQWRGPNRDGLYPEKNLLKSWPKAGPELMWTATFLGKGYASAAVTDEGIFTTGMIGEQGVVFAFDKSGKMLWKKEYGKEWKKSYEGTRTTPTVKEGLLYIEGTSGDVVCMKTADGEIVWRTNLIKEYDAPKIRWGLTESLLIDGDRLICTPGGSKANLIALDRFNGELVWTSDGNGESSAYCSPMLIEWGGKRIIITMTGKSILGINAENGDVFWRHEHLTSYDINPNTPFFKDGKLYYVSGYGTGGAQLQLSPDGSSVKELWRNESLDSQMDAFVVVDGYIYGTSHKKPGWHCLDWNTGEEMYVSPGIGKGNVIYADGLIYCYGENGKVGLIKPNPKSFELISSFKVTQGSNQHWAHTVISEGVLYVRHGEVMMAYKIGA